MRFRSPESTNCSTTRRLTFRWCAPCLHRAVFWLLAAFGAGVGRVWVCLPTAPSLLVQVAIFPRNNFIPRLASATVTPGSAPAQVLTVSLTPEPFDPTKPTNATALAGASSNPGANKKAAGGGGRPAPYSIVQKRAGSHFCADHPPRLPPTAPRFESASYVAADGSTKSITGIGTFGPYKVTTCAHI